MESNPEEVVDQSVIPRVSHLHQLLYILRSAMAYPSTGAVVELGVMYDGFNVLVSSAQAQPDQGEELVPALELTFSREGQLLDFGVVSHDQRDKFVCSNCSLHGDPGFSHGWSEDEFGQTCPLCADVEAVGPDSAGVEALAEVLGAGKTGEPATPVNAMKQPPRPTKERVDKLAQAQRARAKSPILRKR